MGKESKEQWIYHILQMWYTQYAVSNSSAAVDVMTGIKLR